MRCVIILHVVQEQERISRGELFLKGFVEFKHVYGETFEYSICCERSTLYCIVFKLDVEKVYKIKVNYSGVVDSLIYVII